MIYYIACPATARVKIGFTKGEPEVRLKQLQTGSASPLRLLACHDGEPEDERHLHERFADLRLHGEWFESAQPILDHLTAVWWFMAWECALFDEPAPSWLKVGLRAMQDGVGKPYPKPIADLLR